MMAFDNLPLDIMKGEHLDKFARIHNISRKYIISSYKGKQDGYRWQSHPILRIFCWVESDELLRKRLLKKIINNDVSHET